MTKPLITQTAVTYSNTRKINLGNYEAIDIFLSASYTSPNATDEELYHTAVEFVEKELDIKEAEARGNSVNIIAKNKETKAEKPKTEKKAEKPKVEKKTKPKEEKEPEQEGEEELTLETVKSALRDYSKKHSKDKAKDVIMSITGSEKMDSILDNHLADLMIELEKD